MDSTMYWPSVPSSSTTTLASIFKFFIFLTLYTIRMSLHISWLHSLRYSASMQLALFLQTTAHTKHGFIIQIDVVIRPWPTISQSKASAPGTLISFINPLSVENHDFDGMELGSYIVYWSMVKYQAIDDWWSFSLESIHRFLPWNCESARTPESPPKCLIPKSPNFAIFIRTKIGDFYPFFGSILGGGRFLSAP